jgi:hypothetical protein
MEPPLWSSRSDPCSAMPESLQGWPELDIDGWRATYDTLHMWTQIVGKTRLALAPMQNHWWQVALYVTVRGLTTSPMPYGDRSVAVEFDFQTHRLLILTTEGEERVIALRSMAVADFYARYLRALRELGVELAIHASPVEVVTALPFAQDHQHAVYDAHAAQQCWRIFVSTHRVMQRYRGDFIGKQSPAHFFWGSFDLACTRFSGRRAPRHPGGAPNCPDWVMVEAYSHECSSCGFWPGDGESQQPAFYAYAYPEPLGYAQYRVEPAAAHYEPTAREFILPYSALRAAPDPDAALLRFFQSTYAVAANLAQWDRLALDRQQAAGT